MLQPTFYAYRTLILVMLSALVLAGCFSERTVQDSLEDYSERLAYVLDTELPETLPPSLPPLAASSVIKNDIQELNINLRDFYALQDCELGRVVAERNTSLGKSQLPSQRLIYESKLLSVLETCKKALQESNESLAAMMDEWQHQKRIDFVKSWANLIQTSKEIRLALNTPEQLLSMSYAINANTSINSFFFIDSVKDTAGINEVRPIDSAEFEAQLQMITSVRLPASMWRTQLLLAEHLDALTLSLTPKLQAISCPDGRPTDQAKILRNVFYLFFIEEVQPVGSLINQYHYKLQPLWQSWLVHPAFHEDFKHYIATQSNTNFERYSKAIQNHVSLWQGFLKRCNLSPVAPTHA
jgi:hypothetical protein